MTKKWTLNEIGRELGVSPCTVSLVMNNRDKEQRIPEVTASRVRDFCAKVGYHPNIHTRRMRSRIVRNILFYTSALDRQNNLLDGVLFTVIKGVLDAASANDVTVTIRSGKLEDVKEAILSSFRSSEVDGMIAYGADFPPEMERVFIQEGRQVVSVNGSPSPSVTSVFNNNRELVCEFVKKFMIARGRKRFLFLAGTQASYPGKERYAGFRQALAEAGIEFDEEHNFLCGNFREVDAYEELNRFLDSGAELPDAVVCANDLMAIGALRALKQRNISIPEDISLCGADAFEVGRFASPSIASIEFFSAKVGYEAFQLLWQKVNGAAVKDVIVPGELLPRESV